MKINLDNIDREQFHVNEHIVNGEMLYLVIPRQMGCNWTQENKVFRSSVWNSDGELVSASFPKFTNWGEKPEVFPVPTSLKSATIIEKLDGSTLIVSKYKGEYIIRTRGTIDASLMEQNGHEIEVFKTDVLPNFISYFPKDETWNFSVIFEWVSPLNVIVLNYGAVPQFFLIGLIRHPDYELCDQNSLDMVANICQVKRPASYTFDDIDSLLAAIELWQGKEGVCVYHRNDQEIHKVKSAWYLMLHHMKSELSSLEKIVDVWVSQGYPSYTDFYNYIATTFDYELAEKVRGNISNISDAYKEVLKIISHMKSFVEPLKSMSRKDAAIKIMGAYGETNRKSFCFNLLDGKELDGDSIKKLIFQVLK